MENRTGRSASATAVCAMLVMGGAVQAAGGDLQALYATSSVNQICTLAQQIVATTSLSSQNVVYSVWDGFVSSNARPATVVAAPALPWNPSEDAGVPLTTAQHILYSRYHAVDGNYPQIVSCKMKSAEYLVASGLDTNAADQPCQAVHEYFVAKVVDSLSPIARRRFEHGPGVLFEPDAENDAGQLWTAGFPDSPYPVLYRDVGGGPIHIKSSRLLIDAYPGEAFIPFPPPGNTLFNLCTATNGALPGCEPRKWGVRYCHLAAPQYIREAITGRADVPVISGGS
jgi:hypothetical protein